MANLVNTLAPDGSSTKLESYGGKKQSRHILTPTFVLFCLLFPAPSKISSYLTFKAEKGELAQGFLWSSEITRLMRWKLIHIEFAE